MSYQVNQLYLGAAAHYASGAFYNSTNSKKQEDSFNNQLSKVDGIIIAQEDWGIRDLSYNIKSNNSILWHTSSGTIR